MKKPWIKAVSVALSIILCNAAFAYTKSSDREEAMKLTPNVEHGKEIYKTKCALCHSLNGWGTYEGRYPQIAGQHKNVIIKQLADIREGNRDNPTMKPFASEESIGSSQAIADVAAYIEGLRMTDQNGKGPIRPNPYASMQANSARIDSMYPSTMPEHIRMKMQDGAALYKENCEKCHGKNGEGDNDEFYPRVQGQHYHYLLRQLCWIKTGKRRNADKEMRDQINSMDMRTLEKIASYISYMPPPADKVAPQNYQNPDFAGRFNSASRFVVPPNPPVPRASDCKDYERYIDLYSLYPGKLGTTK